MVKKIELPEKFRLFAPWEKALDKILTPLESFIKNQTASAITLMFATILALFLANSPIREAYHHLFEKEIAIIFGSWEIRMTLHHWINEGLMAFFFFLIGLEIKRELLVGELSNLKAALLPVIAAIGGMVFPAIIYVLINYGKPSLKGWGIPMATDIAFAISVLVLLRRYIPSGLVTFLIALAIVDDLGAVIVIALFYTSNINLSALIGAMIVWAFLWILNRSGVFHSLPYFFGGIILWLFMLASGVHATIAGVLTAFTVPTKPKIIPVYFKDVLKKFLKSCEENPSSSSPYILTPKQKEMIQSIHTVIQYVQPPSLRMEHALNIPVALLVIPLFALANAGVHFESKSLGQIFSNPVSLGIILGLLIGKPVGIAGTSLLSNKLGITSLPSGVRPLQIIGIGLIAGIGFTMCLFIAELAWPNNEYFLLQAKMGILFASMIAGTTGYLWLRLVSK